jgi:hypothetical protein
MRRLPELKVGSRTTLSVLIANIDCLFDVNLGSSQSRIARHPFMTLIGVACVGMTGNTSESLASGNNRWRSQICASTVR